MAKNGDGELAYIYDISFVKFAIFASFQFWNYSFKSTMRHELLIYNTIHIPYGGQWRKKAKNSDGEFAYFNSQIRHFLQFLILELLIFDITYHVIKGAIYIVHVKIQVPTEKNIRTFKLIQTICFISSYSMPFVI